MPKTNRFTNEYVIICQLATINMNRDCFRIISGTIQRNGYNNVTSLLLCL